MENEEILDNEKIIKDAIGTSSGGQLVAEQLEEFVETVVDESSFLSDGVNMMVGIESSQVTIDTIGLDSRIMRKGVEGTAPAGTQGITIVRRTLNPVEVVIAFDITDRFLKRNIKRGNAEEVIKAMFARMYMNDLEDGIFNWDTDSVDDFLLINDGLLKRALEDADTNTGTFGNGDTMLSVLEQMYDEMPNKWMQDTDKLRFYLSPKNYNKYRRELKERNTPLGDQMTVGKDELFFEGIKLKKIGKMSDSDLVLTNPANIAVGIGQEMNIEPQRQARKRATEYTVTGYVDTNYAISDLFTYYHKV